VSQDPTSSTLKKRHGCLTAYLILIIAGSSLAMFLIPFAATASDPSIKLPVWMIVLEVFFALFNIVCAFALLGWKKWGFWGLCFSNAAGFVVSIIMGELLVVALTNILVSTGILLWMLHIGDENKGWPQLE
jgi:hypothetical protein